MAAHDSLTKSYADVVKSQRPPHAQVFPPRHEDIVKSRTRRRASQSEDGWTDVSSMSSCSWPSALDQVSVFGDEQESTSTAQIDEPREPPEDPSSEDLDPSYDELLDTRAEHAEAHKFYKSVRSSKRYDLLGPLKCDTRSYKPWHPFPGCHHKSRPVYSKVAGGKTILFRAMKTLREDTDGTSTFGGSSAA